MIFRVRHTTHFSYEKPAYESHNEARMTPRPSPGQRCLESQIEVSPRSTCGSTRRSAGIPPSPSSNATASRSQAASRQILRR